MKTITIWILGKEVSKTLMNKQEFLSFVEDKVNESYYQTVLDMSDEELEFFAIDYDVVIEN